jgi:two-component system, LytTR family, sensor kinase
MTKQRIIRYAYHILFWIFIISFFTFIYGIRQGNYIEMFFVLLGTLPLDILFTYFLIYILIPYLLLQKRYLWFFLTFVVSITIVVFLEWTINYFILYPSIYSDYYLWKDKITYFSGSGLMIYISLGFVVLLASAIKLSKYWLQSQQDKANLEIQSRKSELALLRSQVNPHFLFNTLNNIDALIRKNPDKASDSVMRLSEIMRYFIYETNTDKVPLEKEVDYLYSFIELQRLRYKDSNFVKFQVSGSPSGYLIAPMLFIPFVENAFKHGTKAKENPSIQIDLWILPQTIHFSVINHIDPIAPGIKDSSRGIGLSNVSRRLDLLYPEKYTLNIEETESTYQITLEIDLS